MAADETIWKLNLQAGNSDAILQSFSNSLSVAKDRINQVVAAGENFSKLDSFQTKASEAAKKLELAQANAALALKKAQDAASGGKVSAEQLAVMQARAGVAAENVTKAENALGAAMANTQLEADRLQTAMAEEENKCESLGKVFTFLKDTASSAASGISTGFNVVKDAIGVATEKVQSFASNMQTDMESARTQMVETEATSNEVADGIFSKFKNAAGGISDLFSKAGFAISGVQMVIQTVSTAISAVIGPAEQYQEVLKQTNDVIKSTGGAAGLSAQQITDMATALGQTTFFSRDAVQSGENLLLTFTGIGKDVFPQATKTMLDMSKAMGQDVKSSAIQLGKALNDPATGLTALTRVGVTFTAQQKEQIKAMVAAGNTAGAQKIMLQELQREFGGSADATQTFAGKWQILTDKFNDFKENLGMAVMPALGMLVDFISGMIMPVLDGFASFIQNVVNPAMGAFGGFIQQHILPVLQDLGGYINTWVLDRFNAVKSFIDTNILPKLQEFWSFIQNRILPVLEGWGHNVQVWVLDKLSDLKSFIDTNIMPKLNEFWSFIQNKILPVLQDWGKNVENWALDKLGDLKSFIDQQVMPKLGDFRNYIQNQIVPTLQAWGGNIKTWAIDKFNDLKSFIETQVMPKLTIFWSYIQTQIIPVLQSWGNNIKTYVIDKFNDLKTYVETQLMPKLQALWNFIQTQLVPLLESWGNTIKLYVIDKFNDLKTFIETQVMPKLQQLWAFVQTQIVPMFQNWGDKITSVQNNFNDLKTFIETKVIPALMLMWNWFSTYIIPIFQSLGGLISTDTIPHMGEFTDSVNNLIGALGHLWNALSPVLMPVLEFFAWLVGTQVNNVLTGMKYVLDLVGMSVNGFMITATNATNVLAILADNAANVADWINAIGNALSRLDFGALWSLMSGGPSKSNKPGTGGQQVGSFASGIENFGGGLAFVHANEMLVNLDKGTSVWDPAKTAAFMNSANALKAPAMPAFAASQGASSAGGNDQAVQLLASIATDIHTLVQGQGKGGSNVTLNNTMQANNVSAQKLASAIGGIFGHEYEATIRGAF